MSTKFKTVLAKNHNLKWFCLAVSVISTSVDAASIHIGDFMGPDWQRVTLIEDGSSTTFNIQNTGGNPNQYWQSDYVVPASSAPTITTLRVANIYTAFNYELASQGPFQHLDFSMDLRGFDSTLLSQVSGYYRPAIVQGGQVFFVNNQFKQVDVGNWASASWHFDNSAAWATLDGLSTPDFSVAGSTLQFGYLFTLSTTCNNLSGCIAGSTRSGLDNFKVTVTPVPEPELLLLWVAGLSLLTAFSRFSTKRTLI